MIYIESQSSIPSIQLYYVFFVQLPYRIVKSVLAYLIIGKCDSICHIHSF